MERRDSSESRESNRDSRGFEDSIVSQPQGGGKPHLQPHPSFVAIHVHVHIIILHWMVNLPLLALIHHCFSLSFILDRSPSVKSARPRAAAIDLKRGRGSNKQGSPKLGGDRSRLGSSPSGSPRPSPSSSPKHSRSKSPRR